MKKGKIMSMIVPIIFVIIPQIISILIVILISLIITCLSFFALSFIGIIFGAIISTVVSNMFLLFKCDPKSLRESVILMLINPINYALLDGIACILAVIMFPLNIVI